MSQEKCMVCEETVNPDEELLVNGVWYHDACFKCSQCDECLLVHIFSVTRFGYCYENKLESKVPNIVKWDRGN